MVQRRIEWTHLCRDELTSPVLIPVHLGRECFWYFAVTGYAKGMFLVWCMPSKVSYSPCSMLTIPASKRHALCTTDDSLPLCFWDPHLLFCCFLYSHSKTNVFFLTFPLSPRTIGRETEGPLQQPAHLKLNVCITVAV